MKLKGDKLADVYSALLKVRFGAGAWATYIGGGWIELRGEGLAPNPKLSHLYPNGWSLLDRARCGKVREELRKAAA